MKLNKKLLMAALAGAIVVGGGVNTFAAEPVAKGEMSEDDYQDAAELGYAKENAIQELKKAGVTSELFLNQIRKAKSIASVNALKAELLKSHEDSKPRLTIDQWHLKNAKEEALKELREAGITSSFLLDRIMSAKTIEGVNSLKAELLKAHKEQKPSKPDVKPNPSKPEREPSTPEGPYAPYEPSTPGKEDKKPGETKKPEDKKPETKKPETKKPGKKENTDSPNKKNKKKLPKAGSEAEILTLAAASLSSVAGAFISLKKRK